MIKQASLILCILVSSALADPREAAQQHLKTGVTAYQASDFDTASTEFELAFILDPDPKTLYAWAQALRQAGHCDQAVPLYERYIKGNPDEANISAAKSGISLCDQAKPSTAPPPPETKPTQPPPPTVTTVEPSRWYQDRLGTALVISGVVGLGVGATFLVLAGHSQDAASSAGERDEFVDLLEEATLRRRIGFAGLGLGATLVIGGIVRYATRPQEPAPVALTISGHSIGVVGRF